MMHMMETSVVEFKTPESAIVQTAVIAKHDVRGTAEETYHPVTGQLQMVSNDEISGYYVFDVVHDTMCAHIIFEAQKNAE